MWPLLLSPLQASASIPEEGVVLAGLSPTGAYLVTCTRPGAKAEDGSAAKNLKVSSGSNIRGSKSSSSKGRRRCISMGSKGRGRGHGRGRMGMGGGERGRGPRCSGSSNTTA